jgi:hypothetical protein
MASNAPDGLVALPRKPLVAQFLGVKLVDFERAVVHVGCGVAVDKEAVVVDVCLAKVNV